MSFMNKVKNAISNHQSSGKRSSVENQTNDTGLHQDSNMNKGPSGKFLKPKSDWIANSRQMPAMHTDLQMLATAWGQAATIPT
ncbi:hypothetical protein N7468_004248 [Penicillium chermesinum]|uniref:Uncharacterized protein n=1 Tax=Penicillium chermesinum TaxID=63820 RepID=A0A9W9P7Z4_9EURO|nr:uncharacterized protein N7468_004248 [Penicillium chermesinum]KAJ5239629.1 hypothetical protein N7468_004248 [Penicillium chermesinum]